MSLQRLFRTLALASAALLLGAALGAADNTDLVRGAFQAKERGQFFLAIRLFNEALSSGQYSKRQHGTLLYCRGTSYLELGMREAALADLDGAIALFPQIPGSYAYRAQIWTAERRYDDAIADLQEAQKLSPKDPSVQMNLGNVYARKDELELALQNYSQAIALRPDYVEAYYDRAIAYLQKQDYTRALQDFDKAIALQPSFADAFGNRAALHLAEGDFDKAAADLDTAIRLAPSDAKFREARATAYLTDGRYRDAASEFDRALMIDPGNPALYFGRGRANLFLGETSAAIEDLKIALRLRPLDPIPVIWLHIAHLHGNLADEDEFAANATRIKRGEWPRVVMDLYLGRETPAQIRTKALGGPSFESEKRACEAEFYIADYSIHHGGGKDPMQGVISRCRRFALAYGSAQAELKIGQ